MAQEDGWHELHMPHGACPGALHLLGGYRALVNDSQGCNQLFGKELAAPFVARQGGEGAGHRHLAKVGTEVGFQAPERHEIGGGHAGFPGDAFKQCFVLVQQLPPAAYPVGVDPAVKVVREGGGEFGLAAVELYHSLQVFCACQHFARRL